MIRQWSAEDEDFDLPRAVNAGGDEARHLPSSPLPRNDDEARLIQGKWRRAHFGALFVLSLSLVLSLSSCLLVAPFVVGCRELRMDARLGPYPLKMAEKWSQLSSFISVQTIREARSTSGRIASFADRCVARNAQIPSFFF